MSMAGSAPLRGAHGCVIEKKSATEWRAPGEEHDPSVADYGDTTGFWPLAAKMPTPAKLGRRMN